MRIITILLCLMAASAAFGQQCKLGVDASPNVAGVKLGATEAAIATAFKAKRFDAIGDVQDFGERRVLLIMTSLARHDAKKYTLPDHLTGLDSIQLVTIAGKLTEFTLWHKRKELESLEDFTDLMSSIFKLPAPSWEYRTRNVAKMSCSGFTVNAAMTGEFTVTAK